MKAAWKSVLQYYEARGWKPVHVLPGAGRAIIRKVEGTIRFYKTIFPDGTVKDGYRD